ncbi:MAG: hypothetical protein ACI379_15175, partial [Nocardioides sp.]|uniref:hypothetical protein n=1 Tax=Nocardioides sp. TaxID=35761 RepID=UPI003EFFCBEC
GGAVTLTDSPVSGAVRTNGAVQATNSTITGKVTSLAQGVTLTNSGSGEIVAKGNVTTSGTVPITGPVSAGGNVVLTTNVSGDVAASGTINAANVMISGAVSSSATGSEFVVTLVDSVVGGTVQTSGAGVQATRVTLNGATTAGGRVSLTGPVTTKAISSTGRIDATGGGTLGGDLTTSTTATASPAVSITGMTVNGSVRANQLVRLLGRSTVNGSVESAGNVEQTGGRVTGRVLANGSYTGTPSTGIQVDKSVIAGGSVTIQNDTADNATLIGDGTADPSIWAGGKVTLRGTKEAMTTVRGKVTGHVRSTSSAPAIEVQRTWTVTGQLQASGAKATPETCGGEAICSEAQKLKDAAIPATPDVYGCRLKGTSLWYTSTYPTKAACEAAPWYDGKCLANCEWVVRTPGTPYVPPVYWPAAATGAGAAPTGTRPTAPTATVAVPAVTVTIPTSIAGVDIPPPVPEAPSENDLTGIDGGIVLDQGHWLDLGYEEVKAAAVESGYTNALTFSGTDCKRGWGGITDSKAERDIANALTQTGQKYLIDTTGCADPLTDVVALRRVNSDAVLLVKNYEVALSSFLATNGTPTSPRRIYVIQPDSQFDRDPTCNNNNAPGNTQAAEQTGRSRFKFSSSYGRDSIHTMYYSPCGMGGIGGNTNLTDIYGQVLIGASSSAEFVQFFCRPMALGSRPLFNLTCDLPQPASDVDGTGGVKSYLLGAATVQTEP